MNNGIDWQALTNIFNGFIEEPGFIKVRVYHPAYDEGLEVTVPDNMREDFMKRLPFFDALISSGRNTQPGEQ